MCGRFAQTSTGEELLDLFDLIAGIDAPTRYNLAPTMNIIVIRNSAQGRIGQHTRWGLVPSWAPDVKRGASMINARSESIFDKPSFAALTKTQRCIIPANGFYEWTSTPQGKMPTLFTPRDGHLFRFAGLWSTWASDDGEVIYTSTILTTAANATMAQFHRRMPVMLTNDGANTWLNPTVSEPDQLRPLFASAPDTAIDFRPITQRVNSVRNDDPQCWDPYTGAEW